MSQLARARLVDLAGAAHNGPEAVTFDPDLQRCFHTPGFPLQSTIDTRTVVPAPGELSTQTRPPALRTRSTTDARPAWRDAPGACDTSAGSKPRPSSATLAPNRPPSCST